MERRRERVNRWWFSDAALQEVREMVERADARADAERRFEAMKRRTARRAGREGSREKRTKDKA